MTRPPPRRLDSFLADCRVGTRARVSEAIEAGRVGIAGVVDIRPWTLVDPRVGAIFDGRCVMPAAPTVVAVLHKPGGLLTTMDDAHGRPCVASVVPDAWAGVCGPVGRLDKATTGALLFTDDGALHASVAAGAPKTYRLTIRGPVSERQLERLRTGVTIRRARVSEANRGDFLTAPAQASRWEEGVLLTIREGRNRQVRRMAKVVGLELVHLHRDSVGPVRCPPEEGGLRDLRAEEVDALLAFGPSAAERKARAARDLRARRARGALSDRELQLVDEWLLEWTKDNEIRFVAPG